jgi:predicted component of type VI protein secretion system
MRHDDAEVPEIAEITLLRVFVGNSEIERRAFCVKDKICLGRDPYTDVMLEDPAVSRLHLEIRREDTDLVLYDRSSNGTRVNGRRIQRHVLKHRDVCSAGQFTVVVEIHPDSRPSLYDQARREGALLDDLPTIAAARGTRRSPS